MMPGGRFDDLRRSAAEFPAQVAALSATLTHISGQSVTGRSQNGRVEAIVGGMGDVRSVRVSEQALREYEGRTLGQWVLEAVNDGLAQAEALVAAVHSDGTDAETDHALARFEGQMDDLLHDLDRIDRQLGKLD